MDEQVIMVMGPEDDNRVAGELLVKLTAEGNRGVTESIPPSARMAAEPLPTAFGIGNIDTALAELGVTSINKIHSPIPTSVLAEAAIGGFAMELGATYRLRFEDPKTNLDSAANRLKRFNAVAEAAPNYYRFSQVVPNDPMYSTQWGLVKIRCPEAWDRTKGSNQVVVAVVDSGIDLDHPELQPLLLPGRDLVDLVGVAPRPGWHFEGDFLTRDNTPQDEVGHGTHVAGTIAVLTDNNVGVAGVTWHCRLLPVKVLARMVRNSDGAVTGVGTAVDIAAGIRWAADNGADIINLSLGGYSDTFVERDAVAYAIGRGCLVVAAMGNDDVSTPSYPAAYPDVVAVGAVNQSEQRISKANTGGAWGSNMGSHIDVVAPGLSIRSTVWDNSYSNKSGTSMATPHVSGVAALIKSCKGSLTAAEIAQILRDTARNLRDNPADPVPNDRYGYGLVDAKAAIDRACPLKLKFADDPKFKFFDDPIPTLKFRDDPLPTIKFRDDPKLKIVDDPKLKFADDPQPKAPGDNLPPVPPVGPQATPFALSTPHHSMAWQASYPEAYQASIAEYERLLTEYEKQLSQMSAAYQQGQLSDAEMQRFQSLYREYQSLLAEYQQLTQQGRL